MKLYLIIIVAFASLISCQNQDEKKKDISAVAEDTANFTTIQWIDSLKDIGAVEAGQKTEIKFRFKNTGNKPLFIISAVPGCGCTVADYPKEAIAPGGEGLITAGYNVSAGTQGEFRKNIHITTNTKGASDHYVYFYGTVKNNEDSTTRKRPDSATLRALRSKEIKRNLLLKPTKN